jgi:flagellin
MAITFNTNLSAQTTQRYLGIASDKTSSSLAKLSSGSRVPTAKDDAAALAVGTQLKAEVAGLNQASLNAGQANSVLQIADGALSTESDILTRMKSLAVQASSGQLSDSDRSLLNQEYTSLQSEIDRIANVTNFNGNTLIAGGGSGPVLVDQLKNGALAGLGMDVTVDSGVATSDDAFRITYAYAANNAGNTDDTYQLTVTNINTGASQTKDITSDLNTKIGNNTPTNNLAAGTTLEVGFGSLGITVTLNENFDRDTSLSLATTATATSGAHQTLGAATNLEFATAGVTQDVVDQIQALTQYSASTGKLTLQVDNDGSGAVSLHAVTGLRFQLNNGTEANDNTALTITSGGIVSVYATTGNVKLFDVSLAASTENAATAGTDGSFAFTLPTIFGESFTAGATTKSFNFKVGTGTSGNDSVSFSLSAATQSALGISGTSIDTETNANSAITAVTNAITTVSSQRATIGANESRLSFAQASVNIAIQNTTAAESGLLDVDVSSEITNFTSQQVLLQAGISLLAQANQQPALLLRLLQ